MYAYEINDEGFIINNYLVDGDIEIPDGCIFVQLPQPLLFYKPKWTGEEWAEGATQEEIDEITKVEPSPPTQEDRIKELETIVNMLLMGGLK